MTSLEQQSDFFADEPIDAKRYENIRFHFVRSGSSVASEAVGFVIVREGKMVLNVPNGSERDYTVVGDSTEKGFRGDRQKPRDAYWAFEDVSATWADVGGRFEGTWIQEGGEYRFSFVLS
jgi:hypothetical protein